MISAHIASSARSRIVRRAVDTALVPVLQFFCHIGQGYYPRFLRNIWRWWNIWHDNRFFVNWWWWNLDYVIVIIDGRRCIHSFIRLWFLWNWIRLRVCGWSR